MGFQSWNKTILLSLYRLEIKGDQLYAKTSFDYETEKFFDVSFEAKDSGKPTMTYSETLTIYIEDLNDKPTDIIVSKSSTITKTTILLRFGRTVINWLEVPF